MSDVDVNIIGAGLAGSEAAWQCVKAGLKVNLYEMRRKKLTPAHKTSNFSELVCSNTFKSLDPNSAPGLLKVEMEEFHSIVIKLGKKHQIPAGQALGVDREKYAEDMTQLLRTTPNINVIDDEVTEVLDTSSVPCIIATGPLTSDSLTQSLSQLLGEAKDSLYFYDAIAPILDDESLDKDACFYANRYDDKSDDYLNIPLNKEEYEVLIDDILASEKTGFHNFEDPNFFECCLPIEVMAGRGRETLRFGPLKPVGFTDPKTGHRPWAVIQLRRENELGSMWNMVGFQTRMKWGEQKRIFSKLNAFKNAEFLRFGSVHRNTYLNGPKVLSEDLSFKNNPNLFLAGQITGVEGYTESAAMGVVAAQAVIAKINGKTFVPPPKDSIIGALLDHVTHGEEKNFQPMNANLGLLPMIQKQRGVSKKERRAEQVRRSRVGFGEYLSSL